MPVSHRSPGSASTGDDREGKARLRRLLKEGALRRAERDRSLTEEWSALDEAPWREDPE